MAISNAIVMGGGIGGLAAAAALAQRGVAVTLLERAARFENVGAGVQISPNGMAVLRALGVAAELTRKQAVRGQAVQLNNEAGGRVARLDLGLRPDQPYYFVHRADLIDVLAGAAKRGNVTFEMSAQGVSTGAGEVPFVTLSDGTPRRGKAVVAADGLHSVARADLNGLDAPRFTGQVAWRAVVPNTCDHPEEAHVAMGPGRHLVSYPLRGGTLVNLVAVEEREAWAAEGWHHADDPAHLRAAFAGFSGRAAALVQSVETTALWGLHVHPVAHRWHKNNIALLGDAAHPMLPFLAQGANMALEDAWVLADEIKRGGTGWAARYQARRQARVAKVARAAQANAARYHMHAGPKRALAHAALRAASTLAPGRMLGAFDWLYGHDVTDGGQRA